MASNLRVLTPELCELTLTKQSEEKLNASGVWSDYALLIPGVRELDRSEQTSTFRIPRNLLSISAVNSMLLSVGCSIPASSAWNPSSTNWAPILPNRALYPHQREALTRALSRGALLLGDCPGLGKTTSGASIAQARLLASPNRSVLITAPSYLAGVWEDELQALGYLEPNERLWVARGIEPRTEACPWVGARWLFCHYDLLRFWRHALQHNKLCAVIFDEAHMLKSSRSQRTRAARLAVSGSATRIVMTGTPVQNRLSEAHTLLSLTTGPQTWGSSVDFRRRYAGAFHNGYGWQDGTPTHESELQERLDDVYLRRDTSVLETPLPSRTRQKILIPSDNGHLQVVKQMLEGYSLKDVLQALRRSQLGEGTIEWLTKLRKATSLGKLGSTAEHVSALLEQGDSVVVFTWERVTTTKLAGLLEPGQAMTITGNDAQVHRDEIRSLWSSSPEPKALIATYGSLSTGVTLTKANHVVLHDLDFVPATMLQAEARVWRIGQKRPVQSWWCIAEDSLDPMIFRLVQRKAPATALFGESDTRHLADFFGNEEMEHELAELYAWAGR